MQGRPLVLGFYLAADIQNRRIFLPVFASQRDSELSWNYIMDFVYLAAYAMDNFINLKQMLTQIRPNYTDPKILQIAPKVKGSVMSSLLLGFLCSALAAFLRVSQFPSTLQGH